MTYPVDFTPAYEALYAALTTLTGKPRALQSAATFMRLVGPKDDAAQAYGQTLVGKRCFVKISAPSSVTQHVNCDFARYFCTVEVLRLYRPGKDLFTAETDVAMKQAMRDAHLVAQALTYPTALSVAPDASETGIDGGCLSLAGHTTTGPDHDTANSVVRMVDRFTVSITLASVDL
jgi:hypothetical protein